MTTSKHTRASVRAVKLQRPLSPARILPESSAFACSAFPGALHGGSNASSGLMLVTPLPLARNKRTGLPGTGALSPSHPSKFISGNNISLLAARSRARKPFSRRERWRERLRDGGEGGPVFSVLAGGK